MPTSRNSPEETCFARFAQLRLPPPACGSPGSPPPRLSRSWMVFARRPDTHDRRKDQGYNREGKPLNGVAQVRAIVQRRRIQPSGETGWGAVGILPYVERLDRVGKPLGNGSAVEPGPGRFGAPL